MSRYRTLVIGTAPSLKSGRALELFAFLKRNDVSFQQASDPVAKIQDAWDIVFFLSLDLKPAPALQKWIDLVKAKKLKGRFLALYANPLSDEWRKVLDPEIEIGDDHELEESIAYLFEGSAESAASTDDTVVPSGIVQAASDGDFSFQIEPEESGAQVELTSTRVEPSSDFESLSLSLDAADASSFSSASNEPDFDSGDVDFMASEDPVSPASAGDDFSDMLSASDEPVAFGEAEAIADDVEHPDSNISEPLAGRETFNAEIDMDALLGDGRRGGVDTHVGPSVSPPSAGESRLSYSDEPAFSDVASMASSGDMATLQKYAALKERDAREKESTIQVLKGQVSKLDTKLSRSETERRRLTLANDEMKLQLSTLEENLSQKQFHIQKMESAHQEELRGLSLRLDNAIFQASKAQNKLEEFRERVRTDFVKIRAQERELFNKLELQKRDAEALLASKDEQLLSQKREIDRLQYESETLRERLMEETEKAEERSSRLARAVQSLRLANDMLSGLSEEVLPAASENFGDTRDDGEDAA
jgi:regulator of replication initiation timing